MRGEGRGSASGGRTMRFRVAVAGAGGSRRSRRARGARGAAPERGPERGAAPAPPAAAATSAAGRLRRAAGPGRERGGARGRPGGAADGRAGAARCQPRAAAHGGSPPLSRSVAGGSGSGCRRGDAARRSRYAALSSRRGGVGWGWAGGTAMRAAGDVPEGFPTMKRLFSAWAQPRLGLREVLRLLLGFLASLEPDSGSLTCAKASRSFSVCIQSRLAETFASQPWLSLPGHEVCQTTLDSGRLRDVCLHGLSV